MTVCAEEWGKGEAVNYTAKADAAQASVASWALRQVLHGQANTWVGNSLYSFPPYLGSLLTVYSYQSIFGF